MSATTAASGLTAVPGIGEKTASNLIDQFGEEDLVLDAATMVPAWVQENIDGIGEQNLGNLQKYALENGRHDQTDRTLSSLRGAKFKGRYDNHYYAVGQRTDNVVLFYTGYFQGRSYTTTFSGRQSFTRDRVNRLAWVFYSFSQRDFIVLDYERRGEKQYIAEVIDDHDWKKITDTGAIYYQRGRNHKPEHYPDTTKGWQQESDVGSRQDLIGLELVGITADRIAVYRKPGTTGLFRFVMAPTADGNVFRRLYGYTKFKTDRDFDLGEFGTMETFVKKMGENDEWKTYGSTTYVTDDYKQYL